MTIDLTAFLIGLATVLFCACMFSMILQDKNKGLIEFLMIEMFKLEIICGNVLVTNKENGDTFFCTADEYLQNKNKFELSDGFEILDSDNEELK